MSDELALLKSINIQRVMELIASGQTVKSACAQEGISPSTFQRAIRSTPEIVNAFVDSKRAELETNYDLVVAKRIAIIDKILETPIDTMDVGELRTFENYLRNMQQSLEAQMNVLTVDQKQVTPIEQSIRDEFIKKLRKGAILETTVTNTKVTFEDAPPQPTIIDVD